MRLGRTIVSATALALCCVAGLFAATRGVASSHPAMAGGQAKTTITVVMTEFKFKLSKTKNVPVGTVVFKLINRGKIPHDFQINGKKSKLIKPGKTGTLTVVFKKKAAFAYKCTVAGHAQLGMKGALGVGTAKVPTTTTTATTPTTTTTTTTGAACASPTSSTVSVSMIEYAFHLSTMSVHCGTVTFQVKNDGSAAHDLVFPGIQNAATLLVAPGGSTTLIVNFTNAGSFTYICDVPGHDRLGMVGTLTVTP